MCIVQVEGKANPGGIAHRPEAVPGRPIHSVAVSLYGGAIVGSRAQTGTVSR